VLGYGSIDFGPVNAVKASSFLNIFISFYVCTKEAGPYDGLMLAVDYD